MGNPSTVIVLLMTKKSVNAIVSRRPFIPVEVRMIDGQRFQLRSIEQFIVGRNDIAALTRAGTIIHFSIGLISTIRPLAQRRKRA